MTFSKFVEVYEDDLRHRIKKTTWFGKETIIRSKLLTYFGDMRMNEITPKHVRHWQKQMIEYRDDNGAGILGRFLQQYGAEIIGVLHLKMPDSIGDEKELKRSLEKNKELVKKAEKKISRSVRFLISGKPTQK